MKRCLCPRQLLCRSRRTSCSLHRPAFVFQNRLRSPLDGGPSSRRQWSRPFSASAASAAKHSKLFESYVTGVPPKCPVYGIKQQKDPNSWIPSLDKYLTPSLREDETEDLYARAHGLATILSYARFYGKLDLLSHLGYGLNRWSDVHNLLNVLLDAADGTRHPTRVSLSSLDWGSDAGFTLERLTRHAPLLTNVKVKKSPESNTPTFRDLTQRSFANDFSELLMSQVWQSLGSIVLQAADRSPDELKLGMSFVFRTLARLHHSGAISDNIYKCANPDPNPATYRPPGMHLLSTHIMNVLSETAWGVHEAEVAAKAAEMGVKSPYVPFKMGIRDLGPEIWLELILWCCIEHGYVREGLWLLEQMKARTDDLAWSFQSWEPLLRDGGAAVVENTSIDTEQFWRRPGDDAPVQQQTEQKRNTNFHGLAKRTISTEVAASLRDCFVNFVYRGLGYRGLSPTELSEVISRVDALVEAPESTKELQPTTKEHNWLTARVLQSAGLDINADPHSMGKFLRSSPHVVGPWNDGSLVVEGEGDLEWLTPSQLYDETCAFRGLTEYVVRSYAVQRQAGLAFSSFGFLQEAIDTSKSRHIQEFLKRLKQSDPDDIPVADKRTRELEHGKPETSIPQVSNVTYAQLVDLATITKAYPFANWLLFSNDLDGPPIRRSEYGNQTLAPSLLRYAGATGNIGLQKQVVSSLSQPYSLNTLRALVSFRILTGDWDRVTLMLEYIRNHRLKSWGHGNIMLLAGSILRMERTLHKPSNHATPDEKLQSLHKAKSILTRILNGDFNDLSQRTGNKAQLRTLRSIYRIFLSLPGPLADIAAQSTFHTHQHQNPRSRHSTPFISPIAFHYLLSAVIDTQGSAAAKSLWDKWCLEPSQSPKHTRYHEGGIWRLYETFERDHRRGDPNFNAPWRKQLNEKVVSPNLNTVRVIAQGAAKEYAHFTQYLTSLELAAVDALAAGHSLPSSGSALPDSPENQATKREIEKIMEWCVRQFQVLRLPEEEINREVFDHLKRMRTRERVRHREEVAEREREKERIRGFVEAQRLMDER